MNLIKIPEPSHVLMLDLYSLYIFGNLTQNLQDNYIQHLGEYFIFHAKGVYRCLGI